MTVDTSLYLPGAKVAQAIEGVPTPTVAGIDEAFNQSASLIGLSFAVSRKCYGHYLDAGYAGHLAAFARAGLIEGDYLFLRPSHVDPIPEQVAAFTGGTNAPLAFIDWEEDSGPGFSNGMASLADLEQAIALSRKAGVDPGVYGSLGVVFSPGMVKMLVALKVRMLWVAAYDGIQLPAYVLDCGIPVFHQYNGTGVDRDRFYGTPAQLYALAKKPLVHLTPTSAPVNLAPGLAKYTVTTKPGAQLLDLATLKPYSHAGTSDNRTFPFLGSSATCHAIADGDRMCLVLRTDCETVTPLATPVGYGA